MKNVKKLNKREMLKISVDLIYDNLIEDLSMGLSMRVLTFAMM